MATKRPLSPLLFPKSPDLESLIPSHKQMAREDDKPLLPLEIIINILKRLPVKSQVWFQSVCKEWKDLFKTLSFIVEHLHHSDNKNPFLILHKCSCKRRRASLGLLYEKMETIEFLRNPRLRALEMVGKSMGPTMACSVS